MTIRISGLDRFRANLRAVPREVRRATRLANRDTLTHARTQVSKQVRQELGIAAKKSRRRLILLTPKGADTTARMVASNSPIPLGDFKIKRVRHGRTQVGIIVKDTIGKPPRQSSSAFLNPRAKPPFNRVPFRRETSSRLPIARAFGPSMAIQLDAIMAQAGFLDGISEFQRRAFLRQLNRVLR